MITEVGVQMTSKMDRRVCAKRATARPFRLRVSESSFLGLISDADREIARVRITTGNTAISSTSVDGGTVDLVAMDDFIYAEPKTVPESGGIGLMGLGLGLILLCYRRFLAVA